MTLAHWKSWWTSLSSFYKVLPLFLCTLLILFFGLAGGFKTDHAFIVAAILLLGYGGKTLHKVFLFLLPLVLTAVVYDALKYVPDSWRSEIHVQEPYIFDKTFFGISSPEGVLTPNEWWQQHTYPALDLITGFFYIFFIPIYVILAAFFVFYYSKKGTFKYSSTALQNLSPQMMWAFFWVNVIGYTTYYWYPAAPPWYVVEYGLGPANLNVSASAAGCIRFDALLGTNFFGGWYGRSSDVFGAIPSLHVAYPLMAVYYAFKFGTLRTVSVIYWLGVSFAAVYLNHHYVVDVILGFLYGLIVALGMDLLYQFKLANSSLLKPGFLFIKKRPA